MIIPLLLFAASMPANAAEKRYSVTDFDRVQVDGPYQVTLATGTSSAAFATGSGAALERLSVDVQGRTLRVRANASAWGGYPGAASAPATIRLTTRDLQSAAVNGSGSLVIDRAKGLKLAVSVAGSGKASIEAVEADNLHVTMMGSGTVTLGGKAKTLRTSIHGTANLEAATFTADDAHVVADTAGTIRLGVARAATIQASGAGDVDVTGSPACTVRSSGTGQVRCGRR